jgi:hypothetical protein
MTILIHSSADQLVADPSIAGGSCLPMQRSGLHTLTTSRRLSGSSISSSTDCCSDDDESCHSRKSVRFSPTATVRRTWSARDFTDEEIRSSWYQSNENKQMRQDCAVQVRLFEAEERGEIDLGNKEELFCVRGLETHMEKSHTLKMIDRQNALFAVLCEQEAQIERGECQYDDEAIAMAYKAMTAASQKRAQLMGVRDRNEANLIAISYDRD